jgi:hypothetical protein
MLMRVSSILAPVCLVSEKLPMPDMDEVLSSINTSIARSMKSGMRKECADLFKTEFIKHGLQYLVDGGQWSVCS